MTNLLALTSGTVLVGDYRIRRVLGAGGFGITYLADEMALNRRVTIKEYFPADFAARIDDVEAVPRSQDCAGDYKWGLDRFIEEAQTLARFEHPNIVRVFRYFRANSTGYMVLQFEEGKSLRMWLKELGRAPRQAELDAIVAPLLDALDVIHKRDFLHRDIAPDNIILRNDKSPVLIDFGSARGDIASQSRTVSALVKPGYSPYEQYASTTSNQGPWTDIYALGATLYQAVTGKRPPDAPTRVVNDEYVSAREAAVGSFRPAFLAAIDKALTIEPGGRPQSVLEWRGPLLAPPEKPVNAKQRLAVGLGLRKAAEPEPEAKPVIVVPTAVAPAPPDAPQAKGQLLDFIDNLKRPADSPVMAATVAVADPARLTARLQAVTPLQPVYVEGTPRYGIGYGPAPETVRAPQRSSPRPASVAGHARDAVARETALLPAPAGVAPVPMPIRRKRGSVLSRLFFFLRPPWRGLLLKLGVGVGVASLAVTYQNQSAAPPAPVPPQKTASKSVSSPPPTKIAVLSSSSGSSSGATAAPLPDTKASDTRPPEARPLVQLSSHSGPVLALALLQSGQRIVTVGSDTARISETNSGTLARTIALGGTTLPAPPPSSAIQQVGPATMPHGGGPIVSAAVHAAQLVTAHADGALVVWDLERGERITSTRRLDGAVTAVALAGDADKLLVGGGDGKVMRLDRKGGAPETSGDTHKERINAMAHIDSRNALLTASGDKTVKYWDLDGGVYLKRTYRGHNGPVTALDVADDGRQFASGADDGQVRLWSTGSNRLIKTLRAHSARVSALAHQPGGDLIATAAADGTVKIYDLKKGRELAAFQARSGAVRGLVFTTDGRRLATAGDDGSVRMWDVSTVKPARD